MRIDPRSPAIALVLLLLGSSLGCGDSSSTARQPNADTQNSATSTRQLVNASLAASRYLELQHDAATAWQVEGMALTRNRLFVHDAIRDSILVFDLDSAFQRATSVERRINAVHTNRTLLLPASDSTIVLLDRAASVAHVLSDSGEETAAWRWQSSGEASAFCTAADSAAFVFVHASDHYQLLHIAHNGNLLRQSIAPEPWLGYYNLNWLLGHVVNGGATPAGECVFGHFFHLGLAFMPASGNPVTTPYIEALPAPSLRIDTNTVNAVFHKSESVQNGERGPRSIAVSSDSILVLFEGKEKGASARVDIYDATAKSYRHTVALGERIDAVAASTKSVAFLVRRQGRVGIAIATLRPSPGN